MTPNKDNIKMYTYGKYNDYNDDNGFENEEDELEGYDEVEEKDTKSTILNSLRVFVVTATLFLGGSIAIGEGLHQLTQNDKAPGNQSKIEIVMSGNQRSISIGPRPICYFFGGALTALILGTGHILSHDE